jgi:hypothetical protein
MTFGMTGPKQKNINNPRPLGDRRPKTSYMQLLDKIKNSLILEGLAGAVVTVIVGTDRSMRIKTAWNNKIYIADYEQGLDSEDRLRALIVEILYFFRPSS